MDFDDYLIGSDILGAESKITVENVTPPSAVSTFGPVASSTPFLEYGPPAPAGMYGPGSSSGTYYTDKATVTAVQKKLKSLGYFNGNVDGIYGPLTNAAIKNYSGKDGPPDDALLDKLGLRNQVAFSDDEVDSMVVQAKTASTPAQVQVVAAKVTNLAPPELKQEAQAAQFAAATAVTPQQVEQSKKLTMAVLTKMKPMPAWKVGVIATGSACGAAALIGAIMLLRRK